MSLKAWTEDALIDSSAKHFGRVQLFLMLVAFLALAEFAVRQFIPHFYPKTFFVVDWFTTIIFTVEYVARVWIAPVKRAYVLSVLGLVDLLSILPSYIGMGNFTFLKAVRVIRMFRALKLLGAANNLRYFKRSRSSTSDSDVV